LRLFKVWWNKITAPKIRKELSLTNTGLYRWVVVVQDLNGQFTTSVVTGVSVDSAAKQVVAQVPTRVHVWVAREDKTTQFRGGEGSLQRLNYGK
jgi:hypothetical protein